IHPRYYVDINKPISMSNIKSWSQQATYYQSLDEYRADWHLLFNNALEYNQPGSEIYEDATHLRKVFDHN
ncbi:Bromodomain-containing protein, partial [Mycena sp. CBHHK59/15]